MSTDFKSKVKEQAAKKGFKSLRTEKIATLDITKIETAIVYYHGIWSGPSVAAYEILCETLAELPDTVDLILVDANELYNEEEKIVSKLRELFGSNIGAWGETCWVKNGKVVSRAILHWKEYEDTVKHGATRSNRRKKPATTSDIKKLVLKETKRLFTEQL